MVAPEQIVVELAGIGRNRLVMSVRYYPEGAVLLSGLVRRTAIALRQDIAIRVGHETR